MVQRRAAGRSPRRGPAGVEQTAILAPWTSVDGDHQVDRRARARARSIRVAAPANNRAADRERRLAERCVRSSQQSPQSFLGHIDDPGASTAAWRDRLRGRARHVRDGLSIGSRPRRPSKLKRPVAKILGNAAAAIPHHEATPQAREVALRGKAGLRGRRSLRSMQTDAAPSPSRPPPPGSRLRRKVVSHQQ